MKKEEQFTKKLGLMSEENVFLKKKINELKGKIEENEKKKN